jgi:2-aminoadipate transaminase
MQPEKQAINLTRGVPPTEAFPTERLQLCAAAILGRHSDILLQYQPAAGYTPLREWLGQRHGVPATSVLVGNGSLQLQAFLARLLASPGDTVLVEEPSYDRAITVLQERGLRVVGVPLQGDGCDVDLLERLAQEHRPKLLYIIPDFQNPSGITTSRAKREKLLELADRHDFWIVEDNPYRDLRYGGEPRPTLYSLDASRVLFLSSFSKVLSPGLRVGYLLGPPDLVARVAHVAEDTYVSPGMLSQGIVYEFCRRGWLEPNIERLRALYGPRLETTLSALEAELPEAHWTRPEGGFFVGLYLPAGIDGARVRARGQALGLKLSDGRGFFSGHDGGPAGDSFLRLPFCSLSESEILEGMRRLALAVQLSGLGGAHG